MKLSDYFNKNRKSLFEEKLMKEKSFEGVLSIIAREFESYSVLGNDYLNDLTPGEARISLTLITLVNQMHSRTISNSYNSPKIIKKNLNQRVEPEQNEDMVWDYSGGILFAGLGALLGGTIGALAGATIGSFGVRFARKGIVKKTKLSDFNSQKEMESQTVLEINPTQLSENIIHLMNLIDDAVNDLSPKTVIKEAVNLHKEFPEVIRLFQNIMSYNQEKTPENFIESIIADVESILWSYGYEVVNIPIDKELSELTNYYEINRSSEKPTTIKVKPVMKGDETILQGKLILKNE